MRALLCPASLKGVLSARRAAAALARGVRAAGGDAVELPIADGGEGTADALFAVLGGEWREAVVSDPLGRPVPARWLVLPDGRAVIEAAAAIGLPLLARTERDPLAASSRGLGELVARGARRVAARALRRARRQRDSRRWSGAARGSPRATAADDRPLRRAHDACGRRASIRSLRRVRRPRWCPCSSDGSPPWRRSRLTQPFPAPGRRVGSAPRSPRLAPGSSRARQPSWISSDSTSSSSDATSS